MTKVTQDAVKAFQKEQFWKDVNRAFDEMRNDPEASLAYDEETRLFEATIADGLDGYDD